MYSAIILPHHVVVAASCKSLQGSQKVSHILQIVLAVYASPEEDACPLAACKFPMHTFFFPVSAMSTCSARTHRLLFIMRAVAWLAAILQSAKARFS